MKFFKKYFLFVSVFLVSFIASVHIADANATGICYVNSGSSCTINGGSTDNKANFTLRVTDEYTLVDPYTLRLRSNSVKPSVTRGTPVFQNLILRDQQKNQTRTFTNRNGRYLNDINVNKIGYTFNSGIGRGAAYSPVASQNVRSNKGAACLSICYTYGFAQQFFVR